jgi:hypothetical protein
MSTMQDPKDQQVQEVASVAPATVTQVSKQVLEPVKRKYKPRRTVTAEPELHTDIKVHPMVWAKVKEILAEGSYTKVEIVDNETARVR